MGVLGDLPRILKDHNEFGLNIIKLSNRLKMSTFLITQLAPEDQIVNKLLPMQIPELINYKVFIEDTVKSIKFQIDNSKFRATEPIKEKLKRQFMRKVTKATIKNVVEQEDSTQQMKNMTDEALATQLRNDIKNLFKDNKVVTGQQMSMRP